MSAPELHNSAPHWTLLIGQPLQRLFTNTEIKWTDRPDDSDDCLLTFASDGDFNSIRWELVDIYVQMDTDARSFNGDYCEPDRIKTQRKKKQI